MFCKFWAFSLEFQKFSCSLELFFSHSGLKQFWKKIPMFMIIIYTWNWKMINEKIDYRWNKAQIVCERTRFFCIRISRFIVAVFLRILSSSNNVLRWALLRNLESDNLQYNTLGCWVDRLIDQASDDPSVIFIDWK